MLLENVSRRRRRLMCINMLITSSHSHNMSSKNPTSRLELKKTHVMILRIQLAKSLCSSFFCSCAMILWFACVWRDLCDFSTHTHKLFCVYRWQVKKWMVFYFSDSFQHISPSMFSLHVNFVILFCWLSIFTSFLNFFNVLKKELQVATTLHATLYRELIELSL